MLNPTVEMRKVYIVNILGLLDQTENGINTVRQKIDIWKETVTVKEYERFQKMRSEKRSTLKPFTFQPTQYPPLRPGKIIETEKVANEIKLALLKAYDSLKGAVKLAEEMEKRGIFQ